MTGNSEMANDHIESTVYFMEREGTHEEEKPYTFCYPADVAIAQTNINKERHDHIVIHDIRGHEASFNIEQNGFTVLKLPEPIPYETYYDPIRVKIYLHALEKLLKDHLGASHVEIFRQGLRKRHPDFPIATGTTYDFDQPTSVAHVDTTVEETFEEVRRQHGEKAPALLGKRIQWINIWKPLRGPLYDWPLTFCDAATVNANTDLEPADLLYPEYVTENCQVYFSPKQRWHYLSGQEVDELIVFKQSDTLAGASPGVPHCSFFNPHMRPDQLPRESIEARALVYYD